MEKDLKEELNILLNNLPLRDDIRAKIRKKFRKMKGTMALLLFNEFKRRVQELSFIIDIINRYSP